MATAEADQAAQAAQFQNFAFYKQFLKIEDRRSGQIVSFNPNPIQMRIRQPIVKADNDGVPARLIILKARREGCSTVIQATKAHRTFTRRQFSGLTVAHDLETASYLFGMTERMYAHLPDAIRPAKLTRARGRRLELTTGSNIRIETAEDREAGRGLATRFLHCSEVAFWPDARRTLLALNQIVPDEPGTCIALESTANGVGNAFHNAWRRAVNGDSSYVALFFGWHEFPDYAFAEPERFEAEDEEEKELLRNGLTPGQLLWRRGIIRDKCGGDVDLFHQEYPYTAEEAFIVSGRPFFGQSVRKLKPTPPFKQGALEGNLKKGAAIRFIDDRAGPLKIWKAREEGTRYVIFADPAGSVTLDRVQAFEDKGEGEDYSCAQVVNCRTGEQVAEWHGRIDLSLYAEELFRLGFIYNKAMIAVEMNGGFGAAVVDPLYHRLGYPNVYQRKEATSTWEQQTKKLGWQTTSITRPLMLEALRDVIRDSPELINSEGVLSEAATFIYAKNGKPQADSGCHDDRVLALAGAYMLYQEYAQSAPQKPRTKQPYAPFSERGYARGS